MLADGVEASVRSLTSHDEPAIRAMVDRIIARAARGRPVRRVRPDAARPRADPRGVRGAAAGHVPPAHRVPAEQDRRDRVAARGGGRSATAHGWRAVTSMYAGRGASTSRSCTASRRRLARPRSARTRGQRIDAAAPRRRPARPDPGRRRRAGRAQRGAHGPARPDRRAVIPACCRSACSRRTPARRRHRKAVTPTSSCRRGGDRTWATSSSPSSGEEQAQSGRGGQTGDVAGRRTSCACSSSMACCTSAAGTMPTPTSATRCARSKRAAKRAD